MRNLALSILPVLFFITSALGIGALKPELRNASLQTQNAYKHAPLYLPEARYVRLATLGFNGFASDLAWFSTINYFGKQVRGGHDYQWLYKMCDLVTELDPTKVVAFDFCANMLAWEAKRFDESLAILNKAIIHNPEDWKFWYIRGFTYWYFFNQQELARADLLHASRIPKAPAFLASLAARLIVATDTTDTAIAFLQDLIKNTEDKEAKAVLKDRLKRGYMKKEMESILKIIEDYELHSGKTVSMLEELIRAGVISKIPKDPFGGHYAYDPKERKLYSSTGELPLEFFGKTKDSGIFGMEQR